MRDKEGERGRERERGSDCLSGAGSASLLRSSPLCSFLISACALRRLSGAGSTMATRMHKCDKRMCGCVDGNLTQTRGRSVSPPLSPHLHHVFHGLGLYLEVVLLRAVMPLFYAFIHSFTHAGGLSIQRDLESAGRFFLIIPCRHLSTSVRLFF